MTVLLLLLVAALAVWGFAAAVYQLPRDGYRRVPTHGPVDWTSGASFITR